MAEYEELHDLRSNGPLIQKTQIAVIVAAEALISKAGPTSAELKWASSVLGNPAAEAKKVLMLLLAANKNATVDQITSATKEAVQTKVDSVVANLVTAFSGA